MIRIYIGEKSDRLIGLYDRETSALFLAEPPPTALRGLLVDGIRCRLERMSLTPRKQGECTHYLLDGVDGIMVVIEQEEQSGD